MRRETIQAQLQHTLQGIELPFLGTKIPGKVRDSYVIGDKRVLVTSDRLSAFDRILTTIPFKGQLLNDMASYWFDATSHLVRNHILERPHPNVLVTQQVEILPVEVVVRGYLTGSAWRDYEAGRPVSGITLPKGMKKYQRFDKPILTPSTKEEIGKHDVPISSEDIVARGIVAGKIWEAVSEIALSLFEFGTRRTAEQGLILVDTKYEFGILARKSTTEIILADEIHTQDSSRYWLADSYHDRVSAGEDPVMLDKEFVRRWLMDRGYMGEGEPPVMDDEFRISTAQNYIEAYQLITGNEFEGRLGDQTESIVQALKNFK